MARLPFSTEFSTEFSLEFSTETEVPTENKVVRMSLYLPKEKSHASDSVFKDLILFCLFLVKYPNVRSKVKNKLKEPSLKVMRVDKIDKMASW